MMDLSTYKNNEQWIFRGDVFYAIFPSETDSSHEQAKSRPVVIIQNNIGNRFSPTVVVACISSHKTERFHKKPMPTQMAILLDRESVIMCEQIKTISKDRLRDKMGRLTAEQLKELDICIAKSLGLEWIDKEEENTNV